MKTASSMLSVNILKTKSSFTHFCTEYIYTGFDLSKSNVNITIKGPG